LPVEPNVIGLVTLWARPPPVRVTMADVKFSGFAVPEGGT